MKQDNIFLKDWSEVNMKRAEKAIKNFLLSRKFDSNKDSHCFRACRSFKQIDNICGFAYTSTGVCAGLFVCNIQLYFDVNRKYHIYGFVVDIYGWHYCICHDDCGNEIIFPIG